MSEKSLKNQIQSLKKIKQELEQNIQDLEDIAREPIILDDNSIIPGKEIKKVGKKELNDFNSPKGTFMYYMPKKEPEKLPTFGFDNIPSNILSPPVSHVYLLDDNTYRHKHIRINAVVFIAVNKAVKNKDFILKYNISFNTVGKHQLNVYITFNKKEKEGKEYNFYSFDIRFLEASIVLEDSRILSLSKINTVQVFLINKDPKGSRGTVTTVQSGTGEGL